MKEHNQFRLRLNLFDGIVLVLALAAAVFLMWRFTRPAAASGDGVSSASEQYTVCFQRWPAGSAQAIHQGDQLADNIKNYDVGTVVSAQAVPCPSLILDQVNGEYVLADVDGYEDVLVTVESPCTVTDEAVTLGGGYALRVGATMYLRGEGYMASGPVIAMEREGVSK